MKITNEQVKEYINGIALQNAAGKYDYDDIEECLDKIAQYIAELEVDVKNNLGLFTHMQQIAQGHLDKLDKVEEWARNAYIDDISRKRLFKIINN